TIFVGPDFPCSVRMASPTSFSTNRSYPNISSKSCLALWLNGVGGGAAAMAGADAVGASFFPHLIRVFPNHTLKLSAIGMFLPGHQRHSPLCGGTASSRGHHCCSLACALIVTHRRSRALTRAA